MIKARKNEGLYKYKVNVYKMDVKDNIISLKIIVRWRAWESVVEETMNAVRTVQSCILVNIHCALPCWATILGAFHRHLRCEAGTLPFPQAGAAFSPSG